jgi:hypothetical protein
LEIADRASVISNVAPTPFASFFRFRNASTTTDVPGFPWLPHLRPAGHQDDESRATLCTIRLRFTRLCRRRIRPAVSVEGLLGGRSMNNLFDMHS